MSPDKLVHMANQIARSFRSRGHDDAVAATAEHISNYWEPRMRAQLFKLIDDNAADIDPVLKAARSLIRPVAA